MILYPAAGVLFLLLYAFHWLCFSESGARVIVSQLSSHVPGFSMRYNKGTLASGLDLQGVSYKTLSLDAAAGHMHISLSLPALLAFRVSIVELRITDLNVHYVESAAASGPASAFKSPFAIRIRDAEANRVAVRIGQTASMHLDRVATGVKLEGETLSLSRVSVEQGTMRLNGAVTLSLNPPYAFDSNVRLAVASGRGLVMAHGRIHGNRHRVEIAASLPSPDRATAAAVVEPASRHFSATVDLARLGLERLTGMPLGLSNGHLEASGTFSNYAYHGRVALGNPWYSGAVLAIEGKGGADALSLASARLTGEGITLSANARYAFGAHRLTAKMSGQISGRPVNAAADLSVPNARALRANGKVILAGNSLTFSSKTAGRIDARLDAPHLSALLTGLAGTLVGRGSVEPTAGKYEAAVSSRQLTYAGQIFNDAEARVRAAPAGGVRASVTIGRWRNGKTQLGSVKLHFAGADFTTGTFSADWQGLSANLHLEGPVAVGKGQLTGSIGSGTLAVAGQTWRLATTAHFSAGAGRMKLADQCWHRNDSRVCVTGVDYSADRLTLALEASKLNVAGLSSERLDASADLAFGSRPHYLVSAQGDIAMPAHKVSLQKLQARLTGDGATFDYDASGAFVNPWIQDARLSAKGTIAGVRITFDKFALDGRDAAIDVGGQYDFDTGSAAAKLTGKWHGRPVEGSANVSSLPDAPKGNVTLSVADNSAMLNLDGPDKFEASITANDIAKVNPGWQGNFTAKGQFDRRTSSFYFEGDTPGLKFGAWRVSDVHLEGKGQAGGVHAAVSVSRTLYSGQPLGGGKLAVDGKIGQASMSLAMQVAGGEADLHATLGYDKGALSGRVDSGAFTLGVHQWKLRQSFAFTAASGVVVIGNNCWDQGDGHVCLREAHLAAKKGRLALDVAGLPFSIDKPWFAPSVSVSGPLNAILSGSVDASSGKPVFQGNLTVDVPTASLSWQKGKSLPVNLHMRGRIQDNNLDAGLSAKTPDHDTLTMQLRMPDVLAPKAVAGNASLDTNKLGMVTAFIPQLGEASGSLHGTASVNSLTAPFSANISLDVKHGASASIPPAGITLKDLSLTAKGDAHKLLVQASATSGKGKATVNGSITNLFSNDRKATFRVDGKQFTLLDRPDMKLVATPDLTIMDDAAGNLDVAGHFQVDDGNFKMSSLSEQARRPSPDVVVVSGGQQAAPSSLTKLHLDVTVKQFNVDMYGLTSGVEGSVVLTQEAMAPRRAQGTVNLVKGTYSRFGQKFDIDKGTLIFNGPLDNPLVNVVTSRTITNTSDPNSPVTVTLTLSGPANDIQSTITSTPAMSGANALAYLVLGHPLSSTTGTDSQAMSGAALALGLKQALPITRQIQSALGLSELTVARNGVDSTSVVAGKRIGPNLYLEYDYDVFSRIGGILFNYHLTPHLSLETRTGQANSMQLLYNF